MAILTAWMRSDRMFGILPPSRLSLLFLLPLFFGCADAARDRPSAKAEASPAPVAKSVQETPRRVSDGHGNPPEGPTGKVPFIVENAWYQVPVFFGTNRMPKEPDATTYRRHLVRIFAMPSGWTFALLMLASWVVPAAIAGAAAKHSVRRTRILVAEIVGTASCLAAMAAVHASPNAFVFAGFGFVSFFLFRWTPGMQQNTLFGQVAMAFAFWLVCYAGYAGAAARIQFRRDQTDPGSSFGNVPDAVLHYGICDVTVPLAYVPGSGVLPRPIRIGAVEFPEDPERHILLRDVLNLEETEFFRKLRDETARPANPSREAFLFVHGYNNTFKGAAFRTALIARDLEFPGPAILFSWPSRGELEDYPADEEAAEDSAAALRAFVEKLASHSGAHKVHLFAHSMGNRPMTAALQTLLNRPWPEKDRVQEVILAAPDVPQARFRTQLLPDLLGKGPRVTLYASSHDLALATSKAIHKQARAGQGGQYVVLEPGLDTVDASDLDRPLLSLGHNYAFDHPSVSRDIRLVMAGASPPRETLAKRTRDALVYWSAEPRKKEK